MGEEAQRLNVVLPFEQSTVVMGDADEVARTSQPSEQSSDSLERSFDSELHSQSESREVTAQLVDAENSSVEDSVASEILAQSAVKDPPPNLPMEDENTYFVGVWSYPGNEFRVSRSAEGLRFDGRKDATELSGLLERDDEWLQTEMKSDAGQSFGFMRFRAGLEDGTIQINMKLKSTAMWKDRGIVATRLGGVPESVESVAHSDDDDEIDSISENQDAIRSLQKIDELPSDEVLFGTSTDSTDEPTDSKPQQARELSSVKRSQLVSYVTRNKGGGLKLNPEKAMMEADVELSQLRDKGALQKHLARRHRFVDPMFRRRRLKWLERQVAAKNKEREVKYNPYMVEHPDQKKEWPSNKGSVTITWPSPYHQD